MQIVLEVPLEEQAHVFGVLGYPTAGQSKWVGVALLNGQSDARSPALVSPSGKDEGSDSPATPKKRFSERPRSQQAALKCKEPDFQVWLAGKYPEVWDHFCNKIDCTSESAANLVLIDALKITMKRSLDSNPEAAKRWDALLTDFDMRDFGR